MFSWKCQTDLSAPTIFGSPTNVRSISSRVRYQWRFVGLFNGRLDIPSNMKFVLHTPTSDKYPLGARNLNDKCLTFQRKYYCVHTNTCEWSSAHVNLSTRSATHTKHITLSSMQLQTMRLCATFFMPVRGKMHEKWKFRSGLCSLHARAKFGPHVSSRKLTNATRMTTSARKRQTALNHVNTVLSRRSECGLIRI